MKAALALLALPLICQAAHAQTTMQLAGVVQTSRGAPIPGCAVQLFNPAFGPSPPTMTNGGGQYAFFQIPSQVAQLYTITVMWNGTVIYRGFVRHPGPQEPIVIPVP